MVTTTFSESLNNMVQKARDNHSKSEPGKTEYNFLEITQAVTNIPKMNLLVVQKLVAIKCL